MSLRRLANPIYAGFVRYKDERRQGTHEPAITPEEWERLEELRKQHARARPGKPIVRGTGGVLSQIGYCGICGQQLRSWAAGSEQ